MPVYDLTGINFCFCTNIIIFVHYSLLFYDIINLNRNMFLMNIINR